jgi:hypothetical protein
MTITCEACRTNFDTPEELADSAACPVCEHVNRPRERVEKLAPTPMAPETTAEGADPPVKTLVFPAQDTAEVTAAAVAQDEDEDEEEEEVETTRPRPKARQTAGAPAIRLSVLEEGKPPVRYVLEKPRVVLGRGKCDVKISDPEVSREHCAIETREGVVMLRDLKSSNGTLLNGHLVNEHALKNGDQVTIGTTVVKIFLPKAA